MNHRGAGPFDVTLKPQADGEGVGDPAIGRMPIDKIDLHLRCRVAPGRRTEFLAFLREAIPFYESPGGIEVHLWQDVNDDHRFIELVRYADEAAYRRDQERVEHDPQMKECLARWRALLAEPPVVEVYRFDALGGRGGRG